MNPHAATHPQPLDLDAIAAWNAANERAKRAYYGTTRYEKRLAQVHANQRYRARMKEQP